VAGDLIAAYLARLGAGLPSSRAAGRVLAEVEDGLRSAAEDHVRRGVEPARAAELAVEEFGDPGDLAVDFVPVLATAQAHRDGLALLVTGPMIGVVWLASAVLTWSAAPVAVGAGTASVGLVLVAVVPRTAYVVAATGRLGRHLHASPAAAARAVATTARTVVALDASLVLVALPALVVLSRSALPVTLAATAGLLSLTRLVAATRIPRRLGRFRARLT
jgi:hypothetical protein